MIKAKEKGQARMRLVTGNLPRGCPVRSHESFSRISTFLWIARSEAGFSLPDLAKKLGVSTGRLYSFENGSRLPKRKDLEQLAAALGVDLTALIILRLAAMVDRAFRNGASSLPILHRRVVARLEGQAEVNLRR